MNTDTVRKYSGHTVLELFGHVRIAGFVTEESIAGEAFLRVEVPAVGGKPGFTRYYHPKSVYSMSPTDEATVLAVAAREDHAPVRAWEMPQPKAEPARLAYVGTDDDDEGEDERDDDFFPIPAPASGLPDFTVGSQVSVNGSDDVVRVVQMDYEARTAGVQFRDGSQNTYPFDDLALIPF